MASPQNCTHKGCEKLFTDPEEPCHHHPGAPVFHEGQKGWQCCKPRVLTFDEFLTIPPCTVGKHSTSAPALAPVQTSGPNAGTSVSNQNAAAPTTIGGVEHYGTPSSSGTSTPAPERKRNPVPTVASTVPSTAPKEPKPLEQDPAGVVVPSGAKCKRLACDVMYDGTRSDNEKCVFHPGAPIFHEGSKGYSCCKRRVLEFEEFLKITGCETTQRHLFVGEQKEEVKAEEIIDDVRNDFYQTYTDVIVSIFAKKVKKGEEKVVFEERTLSVDLPMDGGKRAKMELPLFGPIDTEGSTYKVMGTKVELKLKKADTTSWPVLRSDEETVEIIQVGKPGMA